MKQVEMGAERTLMWKPMHFAKRRMTGREVHALASQLRGGACLGAKGQTEKYGKYAGMYRTYRYQLLLGRPPELPYEIR
jgi:hypothetical protein